MAEQQYRVIADRDKGDDPQLDAIQQGDRFTYEALDGTTDRLVRIERPVPTTDEVDPPLTLGDAIRSLDRFGSESDPTLVRGQDVMDVLSAYGVLATSSPHPPTREQAYEAVAAAMGYKSLTQWERTAIDALLALIQNGADRG